MECSPKEFPVKRLVEAWDSGSLARNREYQRGAAWTLPQKQALIDSIFRDYPLPPLFLQKLEGRGLDNGESNTRYDVVDGQQRLLALSEYLSDSWALLKPEDRKLRLPNSLRSNPAPWAGRSYKALTNELQAKLQSASLRAYVIERVAHPDEVRDLFIRLQSGTALSRQQIRDAWPGNIGPYIENLAGKLNKTPREPLFQVVDKRGTRPEDEDRRDRYVADRQTCAQLLRLFLARKHDPYDCPSVGPNDLDTLYHEHTLFEGQGETALRFEQVLESARKIVDRAIQVSDRRRNKIKKMDVFSLVMFFQGVSHNEAFKITREGTDRLARALLDVEAPGLAGKSTSGRRIAEYYNYWRDKIGDVGIRLDARREFNSEQKRLIRVKCQGLCQVCNAPVPDEEAEYDHYPVPHRDGGKTEVENGRLVHAQCHPRGRPLADQ